MYNEVTMLLFVLLLLLSYSFVQCWICQIFPGGPFPSLLFTLPFPSLSLPSPFPSLPYPSPLLPFSPPTLLPFPPSPSSPLWFPLGFRLPLPLPSLPLEVGPLFAARECGCVGERLSSPTGSGQSPAAKRFMVHFSRKI